MSGWKVSTPLDQCDFCCLIRGPRAREDIRVVLTGKFVNENASETVHRTLKQTGKKIENEFQHKMGNRTEY